MNMTTTITTKNYDKTSVLTPVEDNREHEIGLWQSVGGVKQNEPVFSIGTAAAMLEVHPRTLRIYEQEGLIHPLRKGTRRYYSLNDIQWVVCLRSMIHDHGISVAGIKKLLRYTACWSIVNCPLSKRKECTAYQSYEKQAYEKQAETQKGVMPSSS
jgi:MerR family transcriptional regulator/heat shock protein HspR